MKSTKDLVSLTIPLHTKPEKVLAIIQEQLDAGLTLIGIIHSMIIFKKHSTYTDPKLRIEVDKHLLDGAIKLWEKQYKRFDYEDNLWRVLKAKIEMSAFHHKVTLDSEDLKQFLIELRNFKLETDDIYIQLLEAFQKRSIELVEDEQYG